MAQEYYPLGNYIQLSKEKNTNLLAKRHFGLSASEGLVELPMEKGKANKSEYWILKKGRLAIDLINLGMVRELALGRYCLEELGIISNIHVTFNITDSNLSDKYLTLILKSWRTKNILLWFACRGIKMVLPWEDFCNLPIRVPPPSQQEELVRKYQITERVIKLKRSINKILERWMESYYHILFDNLPVEELTLKELGSILTIVSGGTPSTKCPHYWAQGEGIPWIGIKDLTLSGGKFINSGRRSITEEGKRYSNTKLIPKNSILFTCYGSTIGKMGINEKELCISQSLLALYRQDHKENFYYWFLIKFNAKAVQKRSYGTAIDLTSQKTLKELLVNLPPENLIQKFNQACEPFFEIQKKNEQEIRELQKLQRYFIELTN